MLVSNPSYFPRACMYSVLMQCEWCLCVVVISQQRKREENIRRREEEQHRKEEERRLRLEGQKRQQEEEERRKRQGEVERLRNTKRKTGITQQIAVKVGC